MKSRTYVFLALLLFIGASGALADQVITPADGKSWGDQNTAESLLKMNRDPEIVRKIDPDKAPIQVRGTCMDDNDKTYTGDDEEYSGCMNRKASKTAGAKPASFQKKN